MAIAGRRVAVINGEGQQILRFLGDVYADERLDSSALLIPRTSLTLAHLQSYPKGRRGDVVASLPCDEQDVQELIGLGYIERGTGALLRISERGRRALPGRPSRRAAVM